MNRNISSVHAIENLDSQGNPTVRAIVTLEDGATFSATVAASGGSAGPKEAFELRDGDERRYNGQGVLQAVAHVENEISPAIAGHHPTHQAEIDRIMIELDSTSNKHHLGANSILAVSMAVARAGAAVAGLPLHNYLGGPAGNRLPIPMMNILNGGVQANNNIDLEEFMVVPVGAASFAEAIRYGAEVFHALRNILHKSGLSTSVGDEGGFAPTLPPDPNDKACELIMQAIEAAGFRPGDDIAIAIDAAAGRFQNDGLYDMRWSGQKPKTRDEMVNFYGSLIWRYPIVCIEDGLAEDDWTGFMGQNSLFGWKIQIAGDDLYASNSRHIAEGVSKGATNATIIRLGQVGTVTEAINAVQMCRNIGWGIIVADRAADTEDTFTADFAVAMCGGQIKCGSVCRGERVAKYNRLLEIEAALGRDAEYFSPLKWQPGAKLRPPSVAEAAADVSLRHAVERPYSWRKDAAVTQKKRPLIDTEERRENACRPHRLLGYNRDELGMYLVDRGAERIAETQFRRAIWLNPYESEFKIHLAGCLFRQGRYDEAKEWALKALASIPDQQPVLHLLELIDARAAQSADQADAQSAH